MKPFLWGREVEVAKVRWSQTPNTPETATVTVTVPTSMPTSPHGYKKHLPIWVDLVQNGLKLCVWLPSVDQRQVVAEGAQAGLELDVLQFAIAVLVKVPLW